MFGKRAYRHWKQSEQLCCWTADMDEIQRFNELMNKMQVEPKLCPLGHKDYYFVDGRVQCQVRQDSHLWFRGIEWGGVDIFQRRQERWRHLDITGEELMVGVKKER